MMGSAGARRKKTNTHLRKAHKHARALGLRHVAVQLEHLARHQRLGQHIIIIIGIVIKAVIAVAAPARAGQAQARRAEHGVVEVDRVTGREEDEQLGAGAAPRAAAQHAFFCLLLYVCCFGGRW